jgi:transposase
VERFQGPRQVAATARRYGLSPSLLLRWPRSFHPEPKGPIGTHLGFVPAKLVPDPEVMPGPIGPASSGAIEIEFAAGVRMRITGAVDASMVKAAVAALPLHGSRSLPEPYAA